MKSLAKANITSTHTHTHARAYIQCTCQMLRISHKKQLKRSRQRPPWYANLMVFARTTVVYFIIVLFFYHAYQTRQSMLHVYGVCVCVSCCFVATILAFVFIDLTYVSIDLTYCNCFIYSESDIICIANQSFLSISLCKTCYCKPKMQRTTSFKS